MADSAGRKVEIPDRVERVIAAGSPASVLVTILAPEKLIGWNRKPLPEDLPYLPPVVRDLPEIGRLTGRGGTANLEVIIAAKPDLPFAPPATEGDKVDVMRFDCVPGAY